MTDLLRALLSGKKQKLISTILKQQKSKYQPTKQIPKNTKHNTFLAMISKMTMPFTYVCHFKIVRPSPTQFLG
jgi:hypothetical protein